MKLVARLLISSATETDRGALCLRSGQAGSCGPPPRPRSGSCRGSAFPAAVRSRQAAGAPGREDVPEEGVLYEEQGAGPKEEKGPESNRNKVTEETEDPR